MRLNRKKRLGMMISVTPLVDVMLILLIFFMVTSTYLNLDMIPLIGGERQTDVTSEGPDGPPGEAPESANLMVRLGADGRPYVSGRAVDFAALTGIVSIRVATQPATQVLILPSGAATTQALVSLMDALSDAGAQNVRVVRLEVQ